MIKMKNRKTLRPPKTKWKRNHLTLADLIRTAWRGITSRRQRSILAGLGIAVGISALVALTAVSDSNRQAMVDEMNAKGADLLSVYPGEAPGNTVIPLPDDAPDAIARQDGVEQVGVFEVAPKDLGVYRSDVVPAGESNGISLLSARPNLLSAVKGTVSEGSWFDDSTRKLPVVVLGSQAAARLNLTVGDRVYIGGKWYGILGILNSAGLASDIDTAAIMGDQWVRQEFAPLSTAPSPKVGEIASIYVRAKSDQVAAVKDILGAAANPASPMVKVSSLSDYLEAKDTADNLLATLGLALGGIALLVGGVGIANTMVVAVMERRGEIGLRRALGARPGQVTMQFVTEAIVLSFFGGLVGAGLGILGACGVAIINDQTVIIPWSTMGLALAVSIGVGALAGFQPAIKAARLAPNTALRSV